MATTKRPGSRSLRVASIVDEADNIRSFELVDPEGDDLIRFEAGAHIHVHMEEGLSRQYSLCNAPSEKHRYLIAVLHEPDGRGGSRYMHSNVKEGDLLTVSGPENHFPLATRGVKQHHLLAGGIGITPMVSMIHSLEETGKDYVLHYCTRTRSAAAFRTHLGAIVRNGDLHFHHDNGDPSNSLDLAEAIGDYRVGVHVYACGPAGFMQAFNDAVKIWPPHVVHQEYFAARALTEEEKAWDNKPFQVLLKKSQKVIAVAANQRISEALAEHGVHVDTDCTEGYCGTCITRYSGGEPVHRDSVLEDADRKNYVMVCCARSRSDQLVLDI